MFPSHQFRRSLRAMHPVFLQLHGVCTLNTWTDLGVSNDSDATFTLATVPHWVTLKAVSKALPYATAVAQADHYFSQHGMGDTYDTVYDTVWEESGSS
jgi:hypothetical protein